jgi:hypothetical protein
MDKMIGELQKEVDLLCRDLKELVLRPGTVSYKRGQVNALRKAIRVIKDSKAN